MTSSSASESLTPERLSAARKALISSSLGAALEWFDIIVYASFAVVIAHQFFPGGNDTIGLILTFGTFAISYLVRPLGGIVLGSYADRRGRKNALTLTMLLMMIGTLIMAVAPTASTIGVWAGLFILASRLIQGFSAGGEFGTGTAFLIETAPHRKAFYSSWQVASQGAAILLASIFGYVLNTQLSNEDLYSWGWRIPFFFGLIVGPVGLYIRARLNETDEFQSAAPENSPLRVVLKTNRGRMFTGAAVVGIATASIYLILYMPTFATKNLGVSASAGYLGGIVAGTVALVAVPLIGLLADRVGPARVMTWAVAVAIVLIWPLFAWMVYAPSALTLVLVVSALGLIMAMAFGPLPALMGSLFPSEIRATGMSLSYNIGVTLLGGFAPLSLTWLIGVTGSLNSPSFYFIGVAFISLVGLWFARRVFGQR
jgi:MHS family proline/betaine transporter-like MFS transporter